MVHNLGEGVGGQLLAPNHMWLLSVALASHSLVARSQEPASHEPRAAGSLLMTSLLLHEQVTEASLGASAED